MDSVICPGKSRKLPSNLVVSELLGFDEPDTIETVQNDQGDHLSYSQLSMYLRCSMQYFYRYVLGLKLPPDLAPSAGTAGHNAVEADHRRKIRTGMNMSLDEMLDYFSGVYDFHTKEVELKPDDDKGRTKDEIVSSLTMYHATLAQKALPILVEKGFTYNIENADQPVRPVIGRIDWVDHKLGIWDNKFTMSRRRKTQLEADTSIQLSTYDAAIEDELKRPPSTVGFVQFIPPGRDHVRYPAEIAVIARSPAMMTPEARAKRRARTEYQYATAERGIANQVFIATDNPMTCGWCGYRAICQDAKVDEWTAKKIQEETSEPS